MLAPYELSISISVTARNLEDIACQLEELSPQADQIMPLPCQISVVRNDTTASFRAASVSFILEFNTGTHIDRDGIGAANRSHLHHASAGVSAQSERPRTFDDVDGPRDANEWPRARGATISRQLADVIADLSLTTRSKRWPTTRREKIAWSAAVWTACCGKVPYLGVRAVI